MSKLPRFLINLALTMGIPTDMLRLEHIPPVMRAFTRNKRRHTTTFSQHCGPCQSARYARQLALGQIHDHHDNPPYTIDNKVLALLDGVRPTQISWQPHPAHEGTLIGDHTDTTSRQVQRRQAMDGFRRRKARRAVSVGSGLGVLQARTAQPRLRRAGRADKH